MTMNMITNIAAYMRALGGLILFIIASTLSIAILATFIIKIAISIKNNYKNKDNDL